MQDIVWLISIRRKGIEYGFNTQYISDRIKYFLGTGAFKTLKIGSAPSMDILSQQAFPHHATLQIKGDEMVIQAHKKLICQTEEKSLLLTKGEQLSFPLHTGSATHLLKIRDTIIRSSVRPDVNGIDHLSPWYDSLNQRYGCLTKAGEGEVSFIYRNLAGKPLTFKILKPEYEDEKYVRRFLCSAYCLKRLSHPQLPSVLEVIEDREIKLYGYVTEYFEGESLKNRMVGQKRLDVKKALDFLKSVTEAVSYLHSQGKIHRDLHPENVLIGPEGNARLVGFTFLRSKDVSGTGARKIVYPSFTAPEEIVSFQSVNERGDIFSLSALFYYVLTGVPPFAFKTSREYVEGVSQGSLPLPEFPEHNEQSGRFKKTLLKGLSREPAERFKTTGEFWQSVQEEAKPLAMDVSPLRGYGPLFMEEDEISREIEIADYEFLDEHNDPEILDFEDMEEVESLPEIPVATQSRVDLPLQTQTRPDMDKFAKLFSPTPASPEIEEINAEAASSFAEEIGADDFLAPRTPEDVDRLRRFAQEEKAHLDSKEPPEPLKKSAERSFGKFQIKAELGRGAVGIVYRAFDTRLQREVALKVLNKWQANNPSEVERFTREAQSASSLDHPNIVTVYETGETEDAYYIAMQLIDGMNLQQYREKHPLQPRQALSLVRDIARALHHAHTRGIIHRDVKPSNIMVDAKRNPYLMDFGLAKDVRAPYTLTKSGEVVGTLIYMAPELLDGRAPSILQDIYSLGVILYELLTGHSLVEGISSIEILSKIVNVNPAIRKVKPTIASDAENICLKALEKEVMRRYQSAEEFADDIDRFLEYKPILAKRPSFSYRIYRTLARYKTIFVLSSIFLVTLTILSVYGFVFYPALEKKRELLEVREKASTLYETFRTHYGKLIDSIPISTDPEGLTPEAVESEKKASTLIRETNRLRYRNALVSDVLPLYRRAYHLSMQEKDRQNMQSLLTELIQASSDEGQRRPLRLELLMLEGKDVARLDVPARVSIEISPKGSDAYLFKFSEAQDGRKRLVPFDPVSKEFIEMDSVQKEAMLAREEFLRAQNLLWEAVFHMYSQNYYVAENTLRRCLEINPFYIDAYFLLCCNAELSSRKKPGVSPYHTWIKKALQTVQASRLESYSKEKLSSCFTTEFIKKTADLYAIMPHQEFQGKIDHLVKIASLPSGHSSLRIGDCFIKVNGSPVTSEASLMALLKGKKTSSCTVLRERWVQEVDIEASIVFDPFFQVVEDPPIFFIWNNAPLNFGDEDSIYSLLRTDRNKVAWPSLLLPPGDYLLLAEKQGFFTVRHPFSVVRDPYHGSPSAMSISLRLPVFPSQYEATLKDLVVIPKGFVHGQEKYQNTSGYLIGRYEVTVREWMEYLKAVNGPLPWDPKKLEGRLPSITPAKPLLHIRDGNLVLRLGEPTWPVFGVSYCQIEEYLKWLNQDLPDGLKKRGFSFRLPTIPEWIRAARGVDNRLYPWGNYPNPKFCKVLEARKYPAYQEPVAKYNPSFLCDESPFGVNDMGGSLSEYTCSYKPSGSNKLYAIKGTGWSDSRLVDIELEWYTSDIISRVSRGFRICAGLDPLYK